jgi:ubiquinone/menaquinone biosynthesis C-methylase UbiE
MPLETNEEWIRWGKSDPLYGVATWPGRDKSGQNPWTDDEFYALGDDWNDFSGAWRKTIGYEAGTVLEIGCGAGRITRRLSNEFSSVIASDVSEDVMAYGKARIASPNITWKLSNGSALPVDNNSVDAVFSCHVFQHFPSNAAQLQTFKEIERALKPGGSFFVHIMLHAFPQSNRKFSAAMDALYRAFLAASTIKARVKRRAMRKGGAIYMHGVSYDMNRLADDLKATGFRDVGVILVPTGQDKSLHSCVYGRKAA